MGLTQRRINLLVFGWLFAMAFLSLAVYLFIEPSPRNIGIITAGILIIGLLFYAYWRGWEYARYVVVTLVAIATPLTLTEPFLTMNHSNSIYVPIGIALILLNPWWVGGVAAAEIILITLQTGVRNLYLDPVFLTIYVILVGLLILSRLATDKANQLSEARQQAEAARQQAEAARQQAEQRADELEERGLQQQRLLDLVATLETPAVELADQVLLAPLVGNLDTARLARISERLLTQVNAQRTRLVILDVAGISLVDTTAAQGLLKLARALRLLGCAVTITGISAEAAHTITRLQIDLSEVTLARSPQEVLRMQVGIRARPT